MGKQSQLHRRLQRQLQLEFDNSIDEARKITGDIVKEAATTMRPGKNDVSESFTSDAILHAPDSFFSLLALVLTLIAAAKTIYWLLNSERHNQSTKILNLKTF